MIIDYQRISGRYIIHERKGKEYYTEYYIRDNLVKFEGEYLNDEKNGKGIEYNPDGQIQFDGEFLNGKEWEGKGYDKNNNIVFELKGGKGLIEKYDNYGILLFEGEYLNGERNGKGKEYGF